MTEDLITWLRAQLDDDERVARAATIGGRWRAVTDGGFGPEVRVGEGEDDVWSREVSYAVWTCDDEADGCPEQTRGWSAEGQHIARHDPARVLAEVDAKRRIVNEHQADGDTCRTCCGEPYREVMWDGEEESATWQRADLPAPCPTVRLLALPYADRPGYREEWRP